MVSRQRVSTLADSPNLTTRIAEQELVHMALPTQVQAALDAAEATLAEANAQPATSTPELDAPGAAEPSNPEPAPQFQAPQVEVKAETPTPPPVRQHKGR